MKKLIPILLLFLAVPAFGQLKVVGGGGGGSCALCLQSDGTGFPITVDTQITSAVGVNPVTGAALTVSANSGEAYALSVLGWGSIGNLIRSQSGYAAVFAQTLSSSNYTVRIYNTAGATGETLVINQYGTGDILNLQEVTTERFVVEADGKTTITSADASPFSVEMGGEKKVSVSSAPTLRVQSTNLLNTTVGDGFVTIGYGYDTPVRLDNDELEVEKDFVVRWSSTDHYVGANDLGIERDAAGVAKVTNGSTGDGRLWKPHGAIYFSSSATTTLGLDTPAKAAGTTAAQGGATVVTQGTANRLTYTGTATRDVRLTASLSITKASAGTATLSTAYIYENDSPITGCNINRTINSNTDTGALALTCVASAATNDYYEIWLSTVNGDDLIVSKGTLLLEAIE